MYTSTFRHNIPLVLKVAPLTFFPAIFVKAIQSITDTYTHICHTDSPICFHHVLTCHSCLSSAACVPAFHRYVDICRSSLERDKSVKRLVCALLAIIHYPGVPMYSWVNFGPTISNLDDCTAKSRWQDLCWCHMVTRMAKYFLTRPTGR